MMKHVASVMLISAPVCVQRQWVSAARWKALLTMRRAATDATLSLLHVDLQYSDVLKRHDTANCACSCEVVNSTLNPSGIDAAQNDCGVDYGDLVHCCARC